jgi:hypothetical protein
MDSYLPMLMLLMGLPGSLQVYMLLSRGQLGLFLPLPSGNFDRNLPHLHHMQERNFKSFHLDFGA